MINGNTSMTNNHTKVTMALLAQKIDMLYQEITAIRGDICALRDCWQRDHDTLTVYTQRVVAIETELAQQFKRIEHLDSRDRGLAGLNALLAVIAGALGMWGKTP